MQFFVAFGLGLFVSLQEAVRIFRENLHKFGVSSSSCQEGQVLRDLPCRPPHTAVYRTVCFLYTTWYMIIATLKSALRAAGTNFGFPPRARREPNSSDARILYPKTIVGDTLGIQAAPSSTHLNL